MFQGRIDVHHHIIPSIYSDALLSYGVVQISEALEHWSPEKSLAAMDRMGIQTAICSICGPALLPIVQIKREGGQFMARQLNEYMAALRQAYPKRFGAFAVLPMPCVEESVEELIYALDVLHLDGVTLMSNYVGQYLGDSVFDPVFDALQARKACVYIHPGKPVARHLMPRPQFVGPDYVEETCFNTTRAAANLIFSQTLDRCPDIRVILAHMGGALPYLAFRLQMCYDRLTAQGTAFDGAEGSPRRIAHPISHYIARMYYDIALSAGKPVLDTLNTLAPGHILFGSDSLYMSLQEEQAFLQAFETGVDASLQKQINRENALALFGQYA